MSAKEVLKQAFPDREPYEAAVTPDGRSLAWCVYYGPYLFRATDHLNGDESSSVSIVATLESGPAKNIVAGATETQTPLPEAEALETLRRFVAVEDRLTYTVGPLAFILVCIGDIWRWRMITAPKTNRESDRNVLYEHPSEESNLWQPEASRDIFRSKAEAAFDLQVCSSLVPADKIDELWSRVSFVAGDLHSRGWKHNGSTFKNVFYALKSAAAQPDTVALTPIHVLPGQWVIVDREAEEKSHVAVSYRDRIVPGVQVEFEDGTRMLVGDMPVDHLHSDWYDWLDSAKDRVKRFRVLVTPQRLGD